MSTVQEECNIMMRNIINDTASILQRNDKVQTKRLKELGIEFNINLGELNDEVEDILKDNSWRTI
jgi:hypothetical protein